MDEIYVFVPCFVQNIGWHLLLPWVRLLQMICRPILVGSVGFRSLADFGLMDILLCMIHLTSVRMYKLCTWAWVGWGDYPFLHFPRVLVCLLRDRTKIECWNIPGYFTVTLLIRSLCIWRRRRDRIDSFFSFSHICPLASLVARKTYRV